MNLGFGLPNLVSSHVPPGRTIYFHSENGILGMGPRARKGEEDPDLVDAMKVHVTLKPGAAFFSQLDAHMMTRGGHLDLAMLGGLQVSEKGDLANWKVPGAGGAGGIGGAMDIAVGSPRIVVLMEHVTKEGQPKIVQEVFLPADRAGVRAPDYHRRGRDRCHSGGPGVARGCAGFHARRGAGR